MELLDDNSDPRDFNEKLLEVSLIAAFRQFVRINIYVKENGLRLFEIKREFRKYSQSGHTLYIRSFALFFRITCCNLTIYFLQFREEIINQTTGSKFLIVKQHIDNMVIIVFV